MISRLVIATLQFSENPVSHHQVVVYPILFMAMLAKVFGGRMPLLTPTNQLGLGKRHWNLETSSVVVEFLPPYYVSASISCTGCGHGSCINWQRGR